MHIVIKYISGLSNSEESEHAVYSKANLDARLTPSEISKEPLGSLMQTHWHSDGLVFCSKHVLFKRPLVSNIIVMQLDESDAPLQVVGFYVSCAKKYYVPRRIRDNYIPRLDTVGLWNFSVEEKVEEKSF